jgi:hypothetical protein
MNRNMSFLRLILPGVLSSTYLPRVAEATILSLAGNAFNMSSNSGTLFSKSPWPTNPDAARQQKCRILNVFWPHLKLTAQDSIESYSAWFEFLSSTLHRLRPHASNFAIQDWEGMLSIVTILSTSRTGKRKEIVSRVKQGYLNMEDHAIERSVELAARLWLGINVRSRNLSIGTWHARDSPVDWKDDESLDTMVARQFPRYAGKVPRVKTAFDESFKAVNLKDICQIRIRWTDNLVDHLKLEGPRGKRYISVYRHKICLSTALNGHQKSASTVPQAGAIPTVIPADVLAESVLTFDLLFPYGDPKTAKFLKSEKVEFWTEISARERRSIGLDEFKFWKEDLVVLWEKLNGPPETLWQTLFDTRNPSQSATLWVAVFGVFLLTIIFGLLTTIYSVKQYRVALKSYELALAQACQQDSKMLSSFCG